MKDLRHIAARPATAADPRRAGNEPNGLLPGAAALLTVLLASCHGPPALEPGQTRRADALLALGPPLFAFDGDRTLVWSWCVHHDRFVLTEPERAYVPAGEGLLLRQWPDHRLTCRFDDQGVLTEVRR